MTIKARRLVARKLRALKYRTSSKSAYIDVIRRSDRTVMVTGTVRSGTTWLAEEILNHDDRFRMIFEPLNRWRSANASDWPWARYLDPDDHRPELRRVLDAVATGRVRNEWVNRVNTKRMVTRRIVKCVSATNLLFWFHRWHPGMRTVHIVRHPFAVADSAAQLIPTQSKLRAWTRQVNSVDDILEESGLLEGPLSAARTEILDLRGRCGTPFTMMVLRWCLENVLPLTKIDETATNHRTLFYETLVTDPASDLRKVESLLGPTSVPDPERLQKPSRTDFHHRVESARAGTKGLALVDAWTRTVAAADRDVGLAVLEQFGLDSLYDDDPMPKLPRQR